MAEGENWLWRQLHLHSDVLRRWAFHFMGQGHSWGGHYNPNCTWSRSHPNMEWLPTCDQFGANQNSSVLPRRARAGKEWWWKSPRAWYQACGGYVPTYFEGRYWHSWSAFLYYELGERYQDVAGRVKPRSQDRDHQAATLETSTLLFHNTYVNLCLSFFNSVSLQADAKKPFGLFSGPTELNLISLVQKIGTNTLMDVSVTHAVPHMVNLMVMVSGSSKQ